MIDQINDKNTKFFPQQEARCIVEEEDNTGEKIEELQELVLSILKHFREKVLSQYNIYVFSIPYFKEHAKNLNVKRQEQKKWEDEMLKSHGIHSVGSSIED